MFKVNDRVRHQEYGEGTIKDILDDMKVNDDGILVEFDKQNKDLHGGVMSKVQGLKSSHCWWCTEGEITPIKSEPIPTKLYASELMELVRKNPKEYEGKRYRVVDGSSLHRTLGERSSELTVGNGKLTTDGYSPVAVFGDTILEPIEPSPEPVPFMEAVKALKEKDETIYSIYEEGSVITSVYSNSYHFIDQNDDAPLTKEILEGKWYIGSPKEAHND